MSPLELFFLFTALGFAFVGICACLCNYNKIRDAFRNQPANSPSLPDERHRHRAGTSSNIYVISAEEDRSSYQPPPEYKWEELPPSYEEAIVTITSQQTENYPQAPPYSA